MVWRLFAFLIFVFWAGGCGYFLPPAAPPPNSQYSQGPPPPAYYPPRQPPPSQQPAPPARDDRPSGREPAKVRPSLERPGGERYQSPRDDDEDRRYEPRRRPYRYEDARAGAPTRRPGATGSCEDSRDCRGKCSDIFKAASNRKKCENKSVRVVNGWFDAYEVIESPELPALEEMDFVDLDAIVDLDVRPLKDAISRYNSRQARAFLAWMGKSRSAAGLIEQEDEDFAMLKDLLKKAKPNNNDPLDALTANLDRGSLMEIAIEEENDVILDLIYDYFKDGCGGDDEDDAPCIFNKYCGVATGMDTTDRRDLLDASRDFSRLLDGLVGTRGFRPDQDDFDSRTDYRTYCNAEAYCVVPIRQRTSLNDHDTPESNAGQSYGDADHPPVIDRSPDDTKICYSGTNNEKCNYFTDARCEPSRNNLVLCINEGSISDPDDWRCKTEASS